MRARPLPSKETLALLGDLVHKQTEGDYVLLLLLHMSAAIHA